jgi:hypothetical protein
MNCASLEVRTVPGLTFREKMTGQITFGQFDPVLGYKDDAAIPVVLSAAVEIPNLNAFSADRAHRGNLSGQLYIPRLGGIVSGREGEFRLFSPGQSPHSREMVYDLRFIQAGKSCWFRGRKYVATGPIWRVWPATTTLHVTIHAGPNEQAPIIAAGILKLRLFDLVALLSTLRATNGKGWRQRWGTNLKFLRFFGAELWRAYVFQRPEHNGGPA